MPQNWLLKVMAGGYPVGTIVPNWVVQQAGNPVLMAQAGLIEPTDEPTTKGIEFREPESAPEIAPAEQVVVENNAFRKRCDELETANRSLTERLETSEKNNAALKEEIGKYVEENNHLREACKGHQDALEAKEKEIAELKAAAAAQPPEAPAATGAGKKKHQ